MASAAAVGADSAQSPLNNDIGEDYGTAGEVTSGVYPNDDEQPGVNGNVDEDDEDEDLPSNPLRGGRRPRPTNGADEDEDGAEAADLFGDEEDGAGEEERPIRQLDDEELDSGDDMERGDRVADEPEPEYVAQEKVTMDLEYPRLPGPEPSDGEMYLLKVPSFMAIEPHAWHHTTFQPPTTDHHNFSKKSSDTFSAHKTALSTLRWRHSPSNPQQLQSNARILRWSDGSLTLQLASDPSTQYELPGKAIAPPQRNPIKPTPTSTRLLGDKGGRKGMSAAGDEKFDARKDGFTYLLRPYDENGTMLVTHKVTTGLSVQAPKNIEDDAEAKLKAALAAANASKTHGDNLDLVAIDQNPEQARLDALQAMKEIEKKNKKTQAAQEREAARANRALGRVGMGGGRFGGGLSTGMLEDDEEEGGGRARPSPHKRAKPSRRRRNSEYSEDEDFGRKRFSREDEYEEDDFLVRSDEDEEVVDDDDDPDDGIVEEERPRRERTPKRGREEVDEDEEADAPGEEDEDDAPAQQGRGQGGVKKRRVVDEDEDEE